MRWIEAMTDRNGVGTRDGQANDTGTLARRLSLAYDGPARAEVSQSDDSIQHAGWDGSMRRPETISNPIFRPGSPLGKWVPSGRRSARKPQTEN